MNARVPFSSAGTVRGGLTEVDRSRLASGAAGGTLTHRDATPMPAKP
jgi:hypothetical protein